MPQVVRTTNELIVNSLFLIGELGVGETPDGFMLETGLELINEILDKFAADSIYIPFLTTVPFDFVVGQGTYSFSDMASADIITNRIVNLVFANYVVAASSGTELIYPLKIISKAEYFNIIRQTNLLTRPAYIFLDKQADKSFITVYPVPNQPYPCSIKVKSMINLLTNQDTLIELPPNYYGFLKLALAKRFTWYYPSSNWTESMEKELSDYYETFKAVNETDLTITPSAIGQSRDAFTFWPNILSY